MAVAQNNGKFVLFLSIIAIHAQVLGNIQQEGDGTIYTEVSDNVFKSIYKDRMNQDSFVDDTGVDGVDGYIDNGMDDFGEPMQDSEDEKEVTSA